jgi:hypothetical protein
MNTRDKPVACLRYRLQRPANIQPQCQLFLHYVARGRHMQATCCCTHLLVQVVGAQSALRLAFNCLRPAGTLSSGRVFRKFTHG